MFDQLPIFLIYENSPRNCCIFCGATKKNPLQNNQNDQRPTTDQSDHPEVPELDLLNVPWKLASMSCQKILHKSLGSPPSYKPWSDFGHLEGVSQLKNCGGPPPKKKKRVFQPSFFKGKMFNFRGLLHLEGLGCHCEPLSCFNLVITKDLVGEY